MLIFTRHKLNKSRYAMRSSTVCNLKIVQASILFIFRSRKV
ncbi:CLUMA_CG015448, isoform A, partial [Clunio marinus]